MKITSNSQRKVVTHYQTIEIEDGPVISAGDSYIDGTMLRVTKIKINHLEGKAPLGVRVSGPRVNQLGEVILIGTKRDQYHMHDRVLRNDELPAEIVEVLAAAAAEDHAAH